MPIWNAPVNDPNAAFARVQMLQLLITSRNPADFNTLLGSFLNVGHVWNLRLANLNFPGVYEAIDGDNNYYAFLGGCSSSGMGRDFWNGCTDDPRYNSTRFDPVNPFLEDWVRSSQSGELRDSRPVPSQCFYVGYSIGGAALPYLSRYNALTYGWPSGNLVSFGAPKSGGPTIAVPRAVAGWQNWVCQGDAVPLIPPRPSTWQRIMAGLSVFQGTRIENFIHAAPLIVIDFDGSLVDGGNRPIVAIPPVEAVQAWLAATDRNQVTEHSIGTYLSRLRPAVPISVAAPITLVQSHSAPQEERAPPVVIAAIQEQQVRTLFTNQNVQNEAGVTIPTDELFKAVRQGKIWQVLFRGTTVAIAPSKRRARGLARTGNDFLRRLQLQGIVATDAILAELEGYLEVARDPNGGFIPPLQ